MRATAMPALRGRVLALDHAVMKSFTPIESRITVRAGVRLMTYGMKLRADYYSGCEARHVLYAVMMLYLAW